MEKTGKYGYLCNIIIYNFKY